MAEPGDIAGQAALSICESLLLALMDRNLLPEKEILGLLQDAADAHLVSPDDDLAEQNAAVAALINKIVVSKRGPRRG